ncbi:MAG TPA: multicopper oxidase domain-containing protein [Candidatus Angelobacter sp.]|nr:multicopper oxidase domain-containing protein [Candidatus Angelobacter sp.]
MKKSRRDLLKLGAMAGAGMIMPSLSSAQTPNTRVPVKGGVTFHGHIARPAGQLTTAATNGLAQFVDQLPIMPTLRPDPNGVTHIRMLPALQKVHRDLPPTPIWGYNGAWPGPTIEVRSGVPVKIKFHNDALPTTHPLPVDFTIHGSEADKPQVRNVVHAHGMKVMPESDGYPEAWISPDGITGPVLYNPDPFVYPNDQQSTLLWYHDHTLGITRLNMIMGLAGAYIIRDAVEDSLKLPKGQFEIPLIIQDRLFNPDGTFLYPVAVGGTHQFWIPEFFGDTMCVNGKAWPVLDVEPRRYRFRMLNGCNARFLNMTLVQTDKTGNPHGMAGPAFFIIGTDGGLLPAPVALTTLLQAPAERFDVIIDFTGRGGQTFVLKNNGPAPYPGGGEVVPTEVMMFRVSKPLSSPDTSVIPPVLNPAPLNISPASATRTRDVVLTELDRASDGFPIIGLLDNKNWDDPVTEDPKVGATEIWNMINDTGDGHPKHIHLVQFQVLSRQPFDQNKFDNTGQLNLLGQPQAPAPEEQNAYKDVVKAYPGTVTKLIMKFDMPKGAQIVPGQRYKYVWHCHILEHEDNEMMRPMDVVG